VQVVVEVAVDEGALRRDFGQLLESYMDITKRRPGFVKTIPLFAMWKGMKELVLERSVFLKALAKDGPDLGEDEQGSIPATVTGGQRCGAALPTLHIPEQSSQRSGCGGCAGKA